MVNIYFLYCSNDSVPTGWTEISSSYQNRLIKIAQSSLLTTAGTDTHTHTITTKCTLASGGQGTGATTGSTEGAYPVNAHAHDADAYTHSIGTGDSLPSRKTYRMIYKDASTFNGSLPAGVACIRGDLPAANWAWDETTDDCYIMLASSYGTKTITSGHTHVYTGGWSATVPTTAYRTSGGTPTISICPYGGHSHGTSSVRLNFDMNSSNQDTYKYWGGGVCKTTAAVTTLPAGSYCFFDGTPPTGWTTISSSYNGYFVKNLTAHSISTGGNDATHTHTVGNSVNNASASTTIKGGGSSTIVLSNHTHATTGGAFSSDLPVPSNVTFLIASNDSDISAVTTRTKTYTMDTLLAKVNKTKTYTADTLIKKQGLSKTYNLDALLKKSGLTKSIDIDILLRATKEKPWSMDALLKTTKTQGYSIDVLLVLGIQTRTKTYAIDLLLANRNTKTYILDALLQKSLTKSYSLDVLVKKTLSKTYSLDALVKKTVAKDFNIDILIKKTLTKSYAFDTLLQKTFSKGYNIDMIIKKMQTKTYLQDVLVAKRLPKAYNMDLLLNKTSIYPFLVDILIKKTGLTKAYSMDMVISSASRKEYYIDVLIKRQ